MPGLQADLHEGHQGGFRGLSIAQVPRGGALNSRYRGSMTRCMQLSGIDIGGAVCLGTDSMHAHGVIWASGK